MDCTQETNNHQLVNHTQPSTDQTETHQTNLRLDDDDDSDEKKSTSLLDPSPIRLQLTEDDDPVLDIPHATANDDTGSRLFQSIWIDAAPIKGSEDETAAAARTNPPLQDHDLFVPDTPLATSTEDRHEDNHFRICVSMEGPNDYAEATSDQQLQEVIPHGHDTGQGDGNGDRDWITSVADPLTMAPHETTPIHHVAAADLQRNSNRNTSMVTDQQRTSLKFLNNTPRNLLTPISKASYKTVPYEILHLISTYLDGHSLSRLNRVDRASHTVTSRKDLWTKLLRHPWNGSMYLVGHDPGLDHIVLKGIYRKSRPREFYVARYQIACQRRRYQLRAYQLRVDQVKRENRSDACHYLNDVLIPPTILLMFILFTIFLFIQISDNEPISWFTCWPLIIIAILIFFTPTLLYFHRWWFRSAGFLNSSFSHDSTSLFKKIIMEEADTFDGVIWLMSCLFSIFLITLSLKLVGLLNGSAWYKIFTPIYIVLFIPFITALGHIRSSPFGGGIYCEIWPTWKFIFFGSLLTFIILLNIHLDGHHMKIMHMFLPLFLLDLVAFIFLWLRAAAGPHWGCLIWLVTFGPFFSTKILLALKLDSVGSMTDVAYSLIFIPLYFTQLLSFLICIRLWGRAHRSFDDPDRSFGDYPPRWQSLPIRPDLPLPDK